MNEKNSDDSDFENNNNRNVDSDQEEKLGDDEKAIERSNVSRAPNRVQNIKEDFDDTEYKIESNDMAETKDDNNNNNKDENDDNLNEEKKNSSREYSNTNQGNSICFEKKKDKILIEVDREKSAQKKYDVYQLSLLNDDSSTFGSSFGSNLEKNEKKILCYRRYNDFDRFYNALKIRFPDCVFPRLSQKSIIQKFQEDPTFIENRRKELQYFINRLYFHDQIGKSEEFKQFISYAIFDGEYYNSLPKKYCYPECEKAQKEKGYINMVSSKFSGFFNKPKEIKKSELETKILNREEEFKNKLNQYTNLLKEIKTLFDTTNEEKKEHEILSNNLLYLKDNETSTYKIRDNGYNKNNFNSLINLNKSFAEILDTNNIEILSILIDQLNYCILDIEGINRAIERYKAFNAEYRSNQEIKNNKYILEEKTRNENDKNLFENTLYKDIQKYDKENNKIYEEIIDKIIIYIKKINEGSDEAYQNSNFNN